MSYQVSIFLENKLGRIEKATSVLSAAKINIRSIHINHTAEGWGVLNLVVSDPAQAQQQLAANAMTSAIDIVSLLFVNTVDFLFVRQLFPEGMADTFIHENRLIL